jgi:GAF domain-containing protein/methyl-accepting chemotaxis protein
MINGFFSPPKNKDDEEKKRFGFWGNLPLSRKLTLAFGLLFVFAAIITVNTLVGLNKTQAAYENALANGIEIRRLSDQLEVSLLQARFNEKSSILRWREKGLDTAFANYVNSYSQNVIDMREDIKQLALFGPQAAAVSTGNITQSQYEANIASLTRNVDAYEKSFISLVDALNKKGTDKNTDLESEFRISARNIEEKINGQANLLQLELTFINTRRSERYYLDLGKQIYIVEVQTLISRLKGQIAETDQLEPRAKTELLTQVDTYLTAFNALVELDREIAANNENLINASSAVESLTAKFKNLGEQLATEDINTARINSAQTFVLSIIIVFIALVFSILLAVTLSQQLTRPILSLTKIAQELSAGKFDQQAQITSADELGTLAQTFNYMTSRLQGALQNLDHRAKEMEQQALKLELTSQQSKKLARQLQSITEISHYISTEKDLKKLLPLITQTISKEFGFYHVGIFLLDDSRKFAVLLAANSPGGQKMLRRQHSLEVGQTGIVGNVTATGNPRIAADTGADAIYFDNPDLPQTHSELALPLKAAGQVIGALDIQSMDINAFTKEDMEALKTLADQVSLAIQNARLFDQLKKTLSETESIQRKYIREAWSRMPKEENLIGYRYSVAGTIELDNETKITENKSKKDKQSIDVPIILRGETIGTLSVQVPINERISADQIELIKAVAERVALSAENARLFEETTRRAESERIISDITSKIGTSVRTESILRTAAKELSQLLDDADIFIDLQTTNNNEKIAGQNIPINAVDKGNHESE